MKNNRHYLAFIIVSFLGLSMALFYGFSQVVAYFRTGADPSTMLLLSSDEVGVRYRPAHQWEGVQEAEGREMDEGTLRKITTDYLAGHYYQFQVSGHGQEAGIKDYFTAKGRKQLEASVLPYKKDSQSHRGTTVSHKLDLAFYSEDGTLVSFSDEVVSFNKIKTKDLTITRYDTAAYDIMMLLEDNFWRIRHKVRKEAGQAEVIQEAPACNKVEIKGNRFVADGQALHLKCMNYYPKDFPWELMWENFDDIDLAKDFSAIRAAGFNSLRVFVPFHTFGEADVETGQLAKMRRLMDEADKQNLKVIITLFDFFLGYRIEEWTVSDRHADGVVNALKDHPALLGWDLKNEPDLDFEGYGKEEVLDWLYFMYKRVKAYDPHHPITIGWSQPEASGYLMDVLDFRSFHFYRNPAELADWLENLPQDGKPLLLEETGMHSYEAWWYPFGKSEKEQADYLDQVLKISREHNLHYAIWTLYDFENVPANVAGSAPWRRNPQMRYGLIDTHMRKKKVYDIVLKYNTL